MKILGDTGRSVFLLIPWLFSEISAIRVDLYLNKDKFGEFLRMDISEKGCTNVPLNWDNQAYSIDTHGSCVKLYDLPYCRGKYVALQPYHGTFQDNLETLGFKQLISSASPCGPKVPSGRYYILNGADGSVLTVEKKNTSIVARTKAFKPYITKNQQFQIDKISLADYEIIPRVHEDLNPLTFDMSLSTRAYPVRRTWKIESVYRGKYVIKNEWNNRCLYKTQGGKVEEHECVAWSPNQEWMFKSIKVQPFFPSKEQLVKNPVRPDDQLPFDPQEEVHVPVFPHHIPVPPTPHPGQPLFIPKRPGTKKVKPGLQDSKEEKSSEEDDEDKEDDDNEEVEDQNTNEAAPVYNKPHSRPNPIVLNPREPFPPVQPKPIFPKGTVFLPPIGPDGKPDFSKPPVPQVRHPGDKPFPPSPVVTDPKKPIWPPQLMGSFGPTPPTTEQTYIIKSVPKKKNSDEDEDEDDTEKDDADENEKDDAEENEKDDAEEKEDADDKDDPEEREEGEEAEEESSRERYDMSSEQEE